MVEGFCDGNPLEEIEQAGTKVAFSRTGLSSSLSTPTNQHVSPFLSLLRKPGPDETKLLRAELEHLKLASRTP